MKEINVGIIGVGGRIGKVHVESLMRLSDKVRIFGICDVLEEAVNYFKTLTGAEGFLNYKNLLEKDEINTIFILTPSNSHYEITKDSIKSGKKNIFCEKPIADTLIKAREIGKIIEEKEIYYQIGYQRRFDSAYSEAKKMVDEGMIGKPILFKSTSRDPFPPPVWACDPAKGGGCYLDILTHDFDLARWFLNSEVKNVYSNDSNLLSLDSNIPDIVDNVTVSLKFKNDTLALVDSNWNSKGGYDVRSEISGSDGTIFIGGLNSAEVTLFAKGGVNKIASYENFLHRFRESYFLEIESFINNLLEDKKPKITEKDGVAAMEISYAALESSKSGKIMSF